MGVGNYNRRLGRFTDWGVAIVAFIGAAVMLMAYLDLPEGADRRRLYAAAAGILFFLLSGFYFYRILAADREGRHPKSRAFPAMPTEVDDTQHAPVAKRYIQPPRHRARRRLPPGG
jgi:peptidoglycan/LPS O-acetylase OafA/YrhL